MKLSLSFATALFAVLFSALSFGAMAQEGADVDPSGWQDAITGQIEAFRSGDGAGALVFAAASFQNIYTDPAKFFDDIANSGYGPIIGSRSHTFGPFNVLAEGEVAQEVEFIGDDQGLYRALYRMGVEDGDWRVRGVLLERMQGIGA